MGDGSWALGNSSYALYLIHYPVLDLFRHFRWVTHMCYLSYIALCLGISLLSFRYFETPVRLVAEEALWGLSLGIAEVSRRELKFIPALDSSKPRGMTA